MEISKMLSNDSYTDYSLLEDVVDWESSDGDTVTDVISAPNLAENEANTFNIPETKFECAGDMFDGSQKSTDGATLTIRTASASSRNASQMKDEDQTIKLTNPSCKSDSPAVGYKRKANDISLGDGVGFQGHQSSDVFHEQLHERPRTPFPMPRSYMRTESVSLWAQRVMINLKRGPGPVLVWNQYRKAWQGEAGGEIWSVRCLFACLDNLSITVGNRHNSCVTQLINGEGRWKDGPDGSVKKLRLDRWKVEQLVRDGRAIGYLR